jgi:hypothetical protein
VSDRAFVRHIFTDGNRTLTSASDVSVLSVILRDYRHCIPRSWNPSMSASQDNASCSRSYRSYFRAAISGTCRSVRAHPSSLWKNRYIWFPSAFYFRTREVPRRRPPESPPALWKSAQIPGVSLSPSFLSICSMLYTTSSAVIGFPSQSWI